MRAIEAPSEGLSFVRAVGGGERIRTDDRLVANQVLYQLSYAPDPRLRLGPVGTDVPRVRRSAHGCERPRERQRSPGRGGGPDWT